MRENDISRRTLSFWTVKERSERNSEKTAGRTVSAIQGTSQLSKSRYPTVAGRSAKYSGRNHQGM